MGQWCGGGGAMHRISVPWNFGREKVNGIQVGPVKKGRKNKEKPRIGYFIINGYSFLSNPLIKQWVRPSASCCFWSYRLLGVVARPSGFSPVAVSPVE